MRSIIILQSLLTAFFTALVVWGLFTIMPNLVTYLPHRSAAADPLSNPERIRENIFVLPLGVSGPGISTQLTYNIQGDVETVEDVGGVASRISIRIRDGRDASIITTNKTLINNQPYNPSTASKLLLGKSVSVSTSYNFKTNSWNLEKINVK